MSIGAGRRGVNSPMHGEKHERRARKFEKQKTLTSKHPRKGGDDGSRTRECMYASPLRTRPAQKYELKSRRFLTMVRDHSRPCPTQVSVAGWLRYGNLVPYQNGFLTPEFVRNHCEGAGHVELIYTIRKSFQAMPSDKSAACASSRSDNHYVRRVYHFATSPKERRDSNPQ